MGLSVASNKPLNSVTTILFNNRKASNDPEVLNQINNAEAIFFAGGDQSEYMHLWSGTPVQAAVQGKIKNVTIGGTSAGCDILGNWIYTAEKGSVDSNEALSDPYNKEMTFSTAFLSIPFLGSIITDTHFVTRDRMGRMIAFLARLIQDSEEKVYSDVSCSDIISDYLFLLRLWICTGCCYKRRWSRRAYCVAS